MCSPGARTRTPFGGRASNVCARSPSRSSGLTPVHAWSTWPLAREFECRVFSCDAGLAKPDPEIYKKALSELGVQPATTVYVGDGGDDELAGAERAGLRAFRASWFTGSAPNSFDYPVLSRCDDVLSTIVSEHVC